jgi:hypothetical protein
MVFKKSLVPAGPVTRTITGPIFGSAANSNVKKGQTLALRHNQFGHNRNPLLIPGDAESIPVGKFLGCDQSRPKLGKECCLPRAAAARI